MFPSYQGASFTKQDVEIFLLELSKQGCHVSYEQGIQETYYIQITPEKLIEITWQLHEKSWSIVAKVNGVPHFFQFAINFTVFKQLVSDAAEAIQASLETGTTSVRLSDSKPATNKISIVSLSHGGSVTSIFDPYFEDKSIANLVILRNLGMCFASQVQVLTTSKTSKKLSKSFRCDFQNETSIQMEIRTCAKNSEHRRFLLLSSGQSLVIGCSLNNIDKNEAAHLEPSTFDETFFNQEWISGTTIAI
jgi:hypothetical protein